MPNIKSASKRVLIAEENRLKNRAVKSEMKTMVKKFDAAVAEAAKIGYSMIEFAGFFGRSAVQVADLLRKNNIEIFGTHTGIYDLINDFEGTVAFHKAKFTPILSL